MTPRGRRRGGIALLFAVIAAIAAFAWWFDRRTKPAGVGPRFVDALAGRHPGTTVTALDGGMVRAALPSGTLVDVRLSPLFDECATHRFRCTEALDRTLHDVDVADALARTPDKSALRPIVLGEVPGYTYGYVAEPLVGALELRYALVAGNAWTYATAAIADRLGLSRDALKASAFANQRAEPAASLETIDEGGTTLYRVRAVGDPAASLADDERMRRFAGEIGARRLYAAVPTRGTLAIGPANAAVAAGLDALRTRLRAPRATTLDSGLLQYDADAPADRSVTVAADRP